jgi:hypothetical protein
MMLLPACYSVRSDQATSTADRCRRATANPETPVDTARAVWLGWCRWIRDGRLKGDVVTRAVRSNGIDVVDQIKQAREEVAAVDPSPGAARGQRTRAWTEQLQVASRSGARKPGRARQWDKRIRLHCANSDNQCPQVIMTLPIRQPAIHNVKPSHRGARRPRTLVRLSPVRLGNPEPTAPRAIWTGALVVVLVTKM